MTLSQLMEAVDKEPVQARKSWMMRKWLEETRTADDYVALLPVTYKEERETGQGR